jgi:hypothetical protein
MRALHYLTKVFSSAGCRTCEWSSSSPPPAQTPPRDRAASSSGPTRPRVMRYKHSPSRIQAFAELTWSSAGVDPGAREMARGSLPHQRVCSQWWVILGPRRAVAIRTEPTHHPAAQASPAHRQPLKAYGPKPPAYERRRRPTSGRRRRLLMSGCGSAGTPRRCPTGAHPAVRAEAGPCWGGRACPRPPRRARRTGGTRPPARR